MSSCVLPPELITHPRAPQTQRVFLQREHLKAGTHGPRTLGKGTGSVSSLRCLTRRAGGPFLHPKCLALVGTLSGRAAGGPGTGVVTSKQELQQEIPSPPGWHCPVAFSSLLVVTRRFPISSES